MTTLMRVQTPSRTSTAARGARYSALPVSMAEGGISDHGAEGSPQRCVVNLLH